ncbi:PREDICTED: interferon gamma receptor 2 [Chrysochloris asiatica]|uniref:Interferon gamma receptor 2 n=1 Tax=Chrysochloris asiatica TaxID=185453 RepID=A0A9B0WM42_CHRAS|nr:PREDICTED: interferon gamma receptor 2 [Chrysochloris asiatica]
MRPPPPLLLLPLLLLGGCAEPLPVKQVGILKKAKQIGLPYSAKSCTLEAQIYFEVLNNFSHQTLDEKFMNQKFSALLITSNFTKRLSTRQVTVKFLHPSSRRSTPTGDFCSQLYPVRFPTGWFAGSLLCKSRGLATASLTHLLQLELNQLEAELALKSDDNVAAVANTLSYLPHAFLSQLPAPQNPKIHLYNAEQVLTWEPVSLSNDSRPVAYRVQYKYTDNKWEEVSEVNCTMLTVCNFTAANPSQGFPRHFNVSLRVRAELGELVSAWATVPWFQHYRNVTIGPPEIKVTPGEGSLIIWVSAPFNVDVSMVTFQYFVFYWEEGGTQKRKGPVENNFIVLDDLQPFSVYCLQVKAELVWKLQHIFQPGCLSNTSCYKTTADATTKFQQNFLIVVGIFLLAVVLMGVYIVMVKYRGLVKYWFHSPPQIPLQIEEYLKNPAHPVLEALDKDNSLKENAWDTISIILFPEKEQEDAPENTLNQSIGPAST